MANGSREDFMTSELRLLDPETAPARIADFLQAESSRNKLDLKDIIVRIDRDILTGVTWAVVNAVDTSNGHQLGLRFEYGFAIYQHPWENLLRTRTREYAARKQVTSS